MYDLFRFRLIEVEVSKEVSSCWRSAPVTIYMDPKHAHIHTRARTRAHSDYPMSDFDEVD
jgi:hypothetical protein